MSLRGVSTGNLPTTQRVDTVEDNLGINTLRDAVNGGWVYFNMSDGVADVFTDEAGVDTGSAVDAYYDAEGDYYAPSTAATLLIQSDTTDGSITFVDSAGSKTITVVGDTQHDTDQSKFGSSSILFDGAGDQLTLADSEDWNLGSGDFTIDAWVRPATLSGVQGILAQYDVGNRSWGLLTNGTAARFVYSSNGSTEQSFQGGVLSLNTWHHVAVTRSGTELRLFLDGTVVASNLSESDTFFNSTALVRVGSEGGSGIRNGHLDEIRLIKGSAAWTSNFTVPTAPYATGVGNMTLPSIEFTTTATPTAARGVILYDPIDAVTLNTDLILEYSRDSGTTWTAAVLEADAVYAGTVEILVTDAVDLTSQPAGPDSIIWRFRTLNTKEIRIHGVYTQWQ